MSKKVSIETDYFTVSVSEDGRHLAIDLSPDVKQNPHAIALRGFVNYLHNLGVERINADHIGSEFLDRSIKLERGNRRLDLVYYHNNRWYECELKTLYECGLNRTYKQVQDQAKYCDTLTLLVPRDQIEYVNSNLKTYNIQNIVVDTYEY